MYRLRKIGATRLVRYMFLLLMHRRTPSEATELSGRINARITALGHEKEAEQMAQTWAEQLVEQGVQKGIQKGTQKGRREGRQEGELAAIRKMVLVQMAERFGPLPEGIEVRVRAIKDPARLDRIVRQLVHAGSLAELDL